MSDANILIGNAFSTADGKGRFAIPAPWRAFIRGDSGDKGAVSLSAHGDRPCAVGYGTNHIQRMLDEIERDALEANARGERFDREEAHIQRFSMIETVNFDDAGRFVLPRSIRLHCGIDTHVMFVSVSRYFQLWSPERLADDARAFAPLRDLARNFLSGEGAGK